MGGLYDLVLPDPLLNLDRPPGYPDLAELLSHQLAERTKTLDQQLSQLRTKVDAVDATHWDGKAARQFRSKHTAFMSRVEVVRDTYEHASRVLATYGQELAAAQALWDRARSLADQDAEAQRSAQRSADGQVAQQRHDELVDARATHRRPDLDHGGFGPGWVPQQD